jgi:hypothetical protein
VRSGEVQKEGGRTGSFGVGRKTPLGAMYQVMFKRGLVRRWKFPDSLTLRFQQPRLYNTYHDVFDLSSQKLSLPTNILEPSCCASSFRIASTLRSQHPLRSPTTSGSPPTVVHTTSRFLGYSLGWTSPNPVFVIMTSFSLRLIPTLFGDNRSVVEY